MPNWVMNELTCIFQTKEECDSFMSKVDEDNFYNSFFPMPEILSETQSPDVNVNALILDYNRETNSTAMSLTEIINSGHSLFTVIAQQALKNQQAQIATGFTNWYDWSVDNWGVKWDASQVIVKKLPDFNTVIYSFNSPWDTPEKFVEGLSKLYPNVVFEMVSGSIENDNHYEFTCKDGKLEITCCYGSFREAVECGKWGGMAEWAEVFEESEESDAE
jgi:hypothetical protein